LKIKALKVKNAYGYLKVDLKFPAGLSFLVGINGSGKTTAIRLIEALLTPNLEQLDRIPHESAVLRLEIEGKVVRIHSSVVNGRTKIEVPTLGEDAVLAYEVPDLTSTLVRDPTSKDPFASYYANLITQHANTPLFLGLERRNVTLHFWQAEAERDHVHDRMAARRRDMIVESVRRRMPTINGMLGASLIDVQIVIQEIFRKRRVEQERFASQLREQILLDAFDYQPSSSFMRSIRQDVKFVKTIIDKRSHVESALRGAGLQENSYKPLVEKFFVHISKLLNREGAGVGRNLQAHEPDELLELALNKPVVDRVLKLIESSERYNREIERLWNPITQFTSLVNRFFADSGKRLAIDEVGWLYISVGNDSRPQPLDILSSGERQLVVIFGHLAINREINKAGIFVIDEPEISLHLKWQEIFVESILEASPGNQFVLATHSPAIVMDRDDKCISLDQLIA
jgi:energy-coupling factor transporter ATP-binding protein EcfA2